MAAEEELEALIARIIAAFQDVLRGDGVTLHETIVLDDYGDEAARQQAREKDTDTHWQEVSDEIMYHHPFRFLYLDGRGLRYYLPAWMIHSLRHFDDPPDGRSTTLNDLLWEMKIPISYDVYDWWREKWETLTPAQCEAVCVFLHYVAEHHQNKHKLEDAEKALHHWKKFCENNPTEQM